MLALLVPIQLLVGFAGPAVMAAPVLKMNVEKRLLDPVEVAWVVPKQGGNDDNCLIKVYEGSQRGSVDILKTLSFKKGAKNTTTTLHAGQWQLEFSGFLAYFGPMLKITVDDGSSHPPSMKFIAKGDAASSQVRIVNPLISGPMGWIKVEPDGSITIARPR
jgi:hypothetical protein